MGKRYQYGSNEMASYYGLTTKGLSFYEEKGIISPEREENGKYRVFTLEDCYHLYESKLYGNNAMTLHETADMIQNADFEKFCRVMQEKEVLLKHEAARLQRIGECTKEITKCFQELEQGIPFRIVERPVFYKLHVRTYLTDHKYQSDQANVFREWNRLIPINIASLRYPKEMALGKIPMDVEINNIANEENYEFFTELQDACVERIPSTTCLFTYLCIDPEQINEVSVLEPGLKWIEENGYELSGDIITGFLAVLKSKDQKRRYDTAWFPIQKK